MDGHGVRRWVLFLLLTSGCLLLWLNWDNSEGPEKAPLTTESG